MKLKTSELTGCTLDYAVTVARGYDEDAVLPDWRNAWNAGHHAYSESWQDGGPLIQYDRIDIFWNSGKREWTAYMETDGPTLERTGRTPLIAAMRAYVACRMGDEVEIPDELSYDSAPR